MAGKEKTRRPMPKTVAEKIAEGYRLKDEGNQKFKAGKYHKALRRYHKVFLYIKGLPKASDEMSQYAAGAKAEVLSEREECSVDSLTAVVQNNLAMTFLKLKRADEAVAAADKCLALQPGNVKALFSGGAINGSYDVLTPPTAIGSVGIVIDDAPVAARSGTLGSGGARVFVTNDFGSLALSLSTTAPSIFSSIDGHSGKPPLTTAAAPPRPRGLRALLRDEL